MFLKYSLKYIIRSWKKTILFFLLIFLLVVMVCTGTSLIASVYGLLAQCEEKYTTIGILEYRGADYPNEMVYDENIAKVSEAFDFSSILENECVKEWQQEENALGYVKGMQREDNFIPYEDRAVLVVYVNGAYSEAEGVYSAQVSEALYASKDTEGKRIYVDSMGMTLQPRHYYLMHGAFYNGNSSYLYFKPSSFKNATASKFGFHGDIGEMTVDITSGNGDYQISPNSSFYQMADYYKVVNNSVSVFATSDLESLLPFQQSILYLEEGESFSRHQYTHGERVCIISRQLSMLLGVSVGDSIPLSMAVSEDTSRYESYWAESGFAYEADYRVTGIVNNQDDRMFQVFIPKSKEVDLSGNHFTYTLGQVKITNGMADTFVKEIDQMLPERVKLTVYDQGYASVTEPLRNILNIAIVLTIVCVIAGIALLALFGFLFIYQQRGYARIMLHLGSRKKNVVFYFLSGAGAVVLPASLLGAVTGYLVSGRILLAVEKITADSVPERLWFSNGNLSMVKAADGILQMPIGFFLIVGLTVFLTALLSSYLFTKISIRSHGEKRKSHHRQEGTKSCSLKGGSLKYAVLSIWRGNLRSLIPALVAFCAVVLLFQLPQTTKQYQGRLEDIYADANIRGHFTDIRGRAGGGLGIDAAVVNTLSSSGCLSVLEVTKEDFYCYMGKYDSDGKLTTDSVVQMPRNAFELETFYSKIFDGGRMVYTNSLNTVPEFYYSSGVIAEYLNGYDDSSFKEEKAGPFCLVSTEFMKQNKIKLGDTICILLIHETFEQLELTVAGSYVKQGRQENIYCPLSGYISPTVLFSADENPPLQDYILDSVSFQLNDGSKLLEFKKFLYEKGYSQVNRIDKIRNFVVLEDQTFLDTEAALVQRLSYMNAIFPVLYVVIQLLAIVMAYALSQLHKREAAIMRGLGASKVSSFLCIFLEQLMLCLIGTAMGILLGYTLFHTGNMAGLIFSALFVFCWLTGAVAAALQMNGSSVAAMLQEE